jgi:hypothetical protein
VDTRNLLGVVSLHYILLTQYILEIITTSLNKNRMISRTNFTVGPLPTSEFKPKEDMTAQELGQLLPLLFEEWKGLHTKGRVSTAKVDALEPSSLKRHFEGS